MSDKKKKWGSSVSEQLQLKPADFEWENQELLDQKTNDWMNREKFSYDIGSDPMYQQYKEQYSALGKLAMEDTMGQASALTGGYANSYAQTVGQQAYQQYMDQLNAMVPELYSMARSNYDAEGQDLYNQIALLEGQRSQAFSEHQAEVNDWYNYLSFLQQREASYRSSPGGGGNDDIMDLLPDYAKKQLEGMTPEQRANYLGSLAAYGQIDASLIPSYLAIYNTGVKSVDGLVDISKIPEDVRNTLWGKKTAAEWDSATKSYVANGVLTQQQVDALTAIRLEEGDLPDSVDGIAYKDRDWSMAYGGGTDWLWGINRNAEFTDGLNTYTTVDLRKKLMEEGMTRKEATDFIQKLEEKYGIG